MDHKPHNAGGVLIYVLLLLSFLSALLGIAFQNAQKNNHILSASLAHSQARQLALSGLDLIVYELKRDGRKEQTDDMSDRWYSYNDGRTFPIDGGEIFIQIQDAGAKPNLNQLIGHGASDQLLQDAVENYISRKGLPRFSFAPLLDYIDGDTQTRSGGAESWDYTNEEPPFIVRDALFAGYADLAMVKGFPETLHRQAENYFSLLPKGVEVNINTADATFLEALLPTAKNLGQALSIRTQTPYTHTGAFLKDIGLREAPNPVRFRVSTEYFAVRAVVRYNNASAALSALIWRDELNFKVLKINWL